MRHPPVFCKGCRPDFTRCHKACRGFHVKFTHSITRRAGKDAFPELRKKNSEWYKGETYIFVDDMNGTVLVLPPEPELEGKNLTDMKDANGKLWMREFIETAKNKGSGWVDYMWSKPGKDKPSKKISYIKRAKMPDGKMVFVGGGIYVE